MEQDNQIDNMIAKLMAGTLSEAELEILIEWYNSFDDTKVVLEVSEVENTEQLKGRIYQRLMEHVNPPIPLKHSNFRKWLSYAAAVLILAVSGLFYFYKSQPNQSLSGDLIVQDVAPGGNRASLSISGGRTIALSEDQEGIVVMGDQVIYSDGSVLVDKSETVDSYVRELVLSTPNGGMYQVTLSDGTQVWLNSGSSLKYPSKFTGKERVVELSGEAYFSVVKINTTSGNSGEQVGMPFKVISKGQEIEVLGTEFNLSTYNDDDEVKTTLVTGSVKITAGKGANVLLPGQQSVVTSNGILVQSVDSAPYIAWKDGLFHFERTSLKEVMKQLARWYNVDVVYPQGVPQETLSGKVKRSVSLNGMLNILQMPTIDIKLDGKTLTVVRKPNH